MPLFGLVQARPWFRSSMWISSVAGISKMLCTPVIATGAIRTYVRMLGIVQAWYKFLMVCSLVADVFAI